MRQDERAPFVAALQRAREAAYPPGEFVGQESFMGAGEIRRLARRACIGPGDLVLDLCCGTGGPGRLITAERGCGFVGVDYSASALEIARQRAGDLPCQFEEHHLPPLPSGRFDVVLLLETMLAFPDKRALAADVACVLEPGGRFAFTVDEGRPLSPAERIEMPDADTVWLVEMAELDDVLAAAGLTVTWRHQTSTSHAATARALLRSFRDDAAEIGRKVGTLALTELLTAHELWSDWLECGRVRTFAIVAEKVGERR